jgi:probable O-glycosylation ligase (exosortase A-associated)
MLRTIFVASIVLFGAQYALRDAFGALLLYLWVAYFRPEAWLWYANWLNALSLSFFCGVYLLIRAPGSDAKFRVDVRSGLLFLFLGLSMVSMLSSKYVSYSWPYWLEFAKTITITYLLSSFITDQSRFRMVLLVIALSLGFESAKQGWGNFVLHPGAINNNPVEAIGDENEVAVALLMLVPVFIALGQTAERRSERWLHWMFGLGVAYRAVSTYSRGGFLACGAMIVVFVLRTRHKVRAALAVALVSFVVISVMPQRFWDRMSTITTSQEQLADSDASQRGRIHFWRVALVMVEKHPLFGIGHNAYNAAYDDYDFSVGAYGSGRSVHSVWFGILSELGIPAFLVYLLIFAFAVGGCQRVVTLAKRGQVPQSLGQFALALQTSFCVLAVGGTFVPWQYREMLWHFVGLSMALHALATSTATAPVPTFVKPLPVPASTFRPPQVIHGA